MVTSAVCRGKDAQQREGLLFFCVSGGVPTANTSRYCEITHITPRIINNHGVAYSLRFEQMRVRDRTERAAVGCSTVTSYNVLLNGELLLLVLLAAPSVGLVHI